MTHEPHRCRTCKSFRYQADGERVAEYGACVRQIRGGVVRPHEDACELWQWCIEPEADRVREE